MLNATLLERIAISPGLSIFRIRPDFAVPDFVPGQYVALGLLPQAPRLPGAPADQDRHKPNRPILRTYSMASPPHEKGFIEFYVALPPQGALTSRLAVLDRGARLYCAPKFTGTFTLKHAPADADLVLAATGTGIAPFISMLRAPSSWTGRRSIALIHGVRHAQDLAYREELSQLAARREAFSYHPVLSRPAEGWSGAGGYVQDIMGSGRVALDPAKTHVYLCGNPAMIKDAEKQLTEKGFVTRTGRQPGNIHFEEYW